MYCFFADFERYLPIFTVFPLKPPFLAYFKVSFSRLSLFRAILSDFSEKLGNKQGLELA